MGSASVAPTAHLEYMSTVVDLATRQAGSIEVALIYDRSDQSLVVFVHDGLTGEELSLPVSPDDAAEVYRHPYAYAHRARTQAIGTSA
jgi:hypothetical protein